MAIATGPYISSSRQRFCQSIHGKAISTGSSQARKPLVMKPMPQASPSTAQATIRLPLV
jgi:hypothetical protein